MSLNPIPVHVFTDAPGELFLKQFPGKNAELGGYRFSFGLDIPQNTEILLVFNRASYTLATDLPIERTAFIAAEPDAIHPYSTRYLDQYGIVISATQKELSTAHWQTAPQWYWFAGINFAPDNAPDSHRGYDYFSELGVPSKADKISVVTSNKVFTEYHKRRVAFLDALIDKIPDHLEIYGRGYRSVNDKADALLPNKYHVALENSGGPNTWTEKLADPFLCWAYPFYAGCTNAETYFPANSFQYLDLDNPALAAENMVAAIQSGLWEHALSAITEARNLVLQEHNLARQLLNLAAAAAKQPLPSAPRPRRYIWSEKSLWPEKGARGGLGDWALRNTLLIFDKQVELKSVDLRRKIEERRTKRRERKLRQIERANKH